MLRRKASYPSARYSPRVFYVEHHSVRYSSTEKSYFKDIAGQRRFLDKTAKELHIKTHADWYNVSRKRVTELGGQGLFQHYPSLEAALTTVYPEYRWDSARFLTPGKLRKNGFWADVNNQRQFLDTIGRELGVTQYADWYKVSREQVIRKGGRALFKRHASLESALKAAYGEHEWVSSRFVQAGRVPRGHWDSPAKVREYLDLMKSDLGVEQDSDWYRVTRRDIEKRGGVRLFDRYHSVEEILCAAYPELRWEPFKFLEGNNTVRGYWSSIVHQRDFFDRIGKELGIQTPADWYRVPRKEVIRRGGANIFYHHASFPDALKATYPEFNWEDSQFVTADDTPRASWKSDADVLNALEAAEAKLDIRKPEDWNSVHITELREIGFPDKVKRPQINKLLQGKYPQLRDPLQGPRHARLCQLEHMVAQLFEDVECKSKESISTPAGLDIYLPSLNLAFKFKEEKQEQSAAASNTSVIEVPFWWNRTASSLIATIKKILPDLLQDYSVDPNESIPTDIPLKFVTTHRIPDIGEPALASFFTLDSMAPNNWWMFEKYDGIRAFWNPLRRTFYSMQGKPLPVPQDILDDMPQSSFLDGEMWFGRDSFTQATKLLPQGMNHDDDDPSIQLDWNQFKYMVFDVPNRMGTYQERYSLLETIAQGSKYVNIAGYEFCKDNTHAQSYLQHILAQGGEGIILRDPNAPLLPGRSPSYLKHQNFRDAEAKIVASVDAGRWECELPNGVRFTAPIAFDKRLKPMPEDIVGFKHRGFLRYTNKPKFPTLYRLRDDLKWAKDSQLQRESSRKPKGYWDKVENKRAALLEFAKEAGFDPFKAENWRSVTRAQIVSSKGHSIVKEKKWKATLATVLPEIQSEQEESGGKAGRKRILLKTIKGIPIDHRKEDKREKM